MMNILASVIHDYDRGCGLTYLGNSFRAIDLVLAMKLDVPQQLGF